MNGFANAILTIMLGWLRSFLAAAWTMLGSERGSAFLSFLRENWKLIFLILCVGGFIVDRVIYLLRWRPYYVWQARRRRRRERWDESPEAYEDTPPYAQPPEPEPDRGAYDFAAGGTARYTRSVPEPRHAPRPAQHGTGSPVPRAPGGYRAPLPGMEGTQAYAPTAPAWGATNAYAPQAAAPVPYQPTREPQRGAQPLRAPAGAQPAPFSPQASFAPTASYAAVRYRPLEPEPLTAEPRFDDDLAAWAAPQSAYDDFAPAMAGGHNPAQGMRPNFGAPQPEPPGYLHAIAPSQPAAVKPEVAAAPVHPGLDLETIQQNIGLGSAASAESPRRSEEALRPGFTPFRTVAPAEPTAKPRGLGALARKARNLVGSDDERDRPTIRDLQPTVDVKSAFREPVYPKKPTESEDK